MVLSVRRTAGRCPLCGPCRTDGLWRRKTRAEILANQWQISASVSVNKNLIDFYNDYPEATLNDSPYTKWAIYANTPASDEVVRDLYPAIRKAIEKKSQRDAANMILHLAETFPYGYDDKIWGRDRAFFLEETWHYPYSDCEDHAIHFSRMIRDIMDLDVVLVYYPGHL